MNTASSSFSLEAIIIPWSQTYDTACSVYHVFKFNR